MSYPTVIDLDFPTTNDESTMGEDYIDPFQLRNLSEEDVVQLEYRRRNPVESDLNFNGLAAVYEIDKERVMFAGEDGGMYEIPFDTEPPGYILTDEYELQVYSVMEPEFIS